MHVVSWDCCCLVPFKALFSVGVALRVVGRNPMRIRISNALEYALKLIEVIKISFNIIHIFSNV